VSGGHPGRRSLFGRGYSDPVETSLPRLRGLAISARTFRRIATANVVALLVVVGTGATVRLTGSGLGCLHWPGCTAGDPFPNKGYHSYIEFSNRIVAGVTIVFTLATFAGALLAANARPWVRWLAGITFVGTLAQAPLGAVTVYYHLNPWLVLSHFLLSLFVLTLGVFVALEAWSLRGDAVPSWVPRVGLLIGVSCVVLVVTGTLATAAGPHAGDIAVRRIGSFRPAIWLHVRATAVFGISFALLLGWLVVRRRRQLNAALVVLALLVVEMAVGEIQYRTKLPWWLVLAHVTLSAALWAATVAFVALLWRPSRIAR
jgi:cytochrome c oxidase assembly protein subunit 15